LERRERRHRRNRLIGRVSGVGIVIAAVVVGILAATGTFSGSNKTATATPATTPSPSASASTASQPAPKRCAKIHPDPPKAGQPKVPDVGKDPTKLVTKDLKAGHGRAAKQGDDIKVDYIGIGCSTGTVFDASYKHGAAGLLDVTPLGQAGVIAGFNQGLVGMRAGGVRELVIPGPLAYAANPSSAPTFPNDTLIFLVTAKSVTAGK
jgi:FKBP-type peptidyl-prolyl cis-trans isomerase